jgi:hypothetical protein
MKVFGLSLTTLLVLFIAFYLGTRFPNALRFGRG